MGRVTTRKRKLYRNVAPDPEWKRGRGGGERGQRDGGERGKETEEE